MTSAILFAGTIVIAAKFEAGYLIGGGVIDDLRWE